MSTTIRTRSLWSVVAVLATMPALPATAASARNGNDALGAAIELPKFVVTDVRVMPDRESWRYTSLPGIEVLSNESDRETEQLLKDFQLFRQAMDIVAPLPQQSRLPLKIIVCGEGRKFDEFLPPAAKPGVRRVSYLLQDQKAAAILLDAETSVLSLTERSGKGDPGTEKAWAMEPPPAPPSPYSAYSIISGADAGGIRGSDVINLFSGMPESASVPALVVPAVAVEPHRNLQREYVRLIFSQSQPRLPLWFEEGFADIIREMRYERDFIEIGRVEPIDMESRGAMGLEQERQFNAVMAQRSIMPFEELFAYSPDREVNPFGDFVWRKQASAFVHLCMFGRGGQWKKSLIKFVDRSAREPVSETLFKECFGMSYKQMAGELRDYTMFTDHTLQQFRGKNGAPLLQEPPAVALRDATDAEVGRIKGHAMVMAGRFEQARAEYIAPYFRGERDAELIAGLGLFELKSGKLDRARKFLTAAVASNTKDPEAHLELARMHLSDAIAAPAAPGGKLSQQQTEAIMQLLDKAHALPPARPDTYELMADVWARSAAKPTPERVTPLIQGAVRFPGRMKIVFAAATFSLESGLTKEASQLVAHGMKYAPDAATRAQFQLLKSGLPQG